MALVGIPVLQDFRNIQRNSLLLTELTEGLAGVAPETTDYYLLILFLFLPIFTSRIIKSSHFLENVKRRKSSNPASRGYRNIEPRGGAGFTVCSIPTCFVVAVIKTRGTSIKISENGGVARGIKKRREHLWP